MERRDDDQRTSSRRRSTSFSREALCPKSRFKAGLISRVNEQIEVTHEYRRCGFGQVPGWPSSRP